MTPLLLMFAASTFLAAGADDRSLLETERRWLQAYVNRDAAVIERIEADEFEIVFSNGTKATRAENLEYLRRPAPRDPATQMSTEGTTIRRYGDLAVLRGVFIHRGSDNGKPFELRHRYLDIWMWRDGRWQVVASQLTAVPAPPEQPK